MSLATAARLSRPSPRRAALSKIRAYSDSHSHEHHHEEDTTVYPKEGFGAGWRNAVLGAFAVAVTYKYAPSPGEDALLTRWMAERQAPVNQDFERNLNHTILTQEQSNERLFFAEAKRPVINRYRFPQMLDNGSPFNVPVGLTSDLRAVKVKHN
ncbi:uncharacterized protein BT62DRAFT_994049 [Guyanagaster necrorhizus]|uniref:Uncharacterized protein n=1 Tax=Guyanagaster necrorhizus TaxID=856835 RepID=A0A9P7VTI7_9AGAR|nr:uncharacterized protein BT62DRAFT_994049 [Guyanagaster necrorhizus MCA 3950]KAG7446425.1 hypothetical protein BT62DRAFT_994049 [Guyanagaster necrorhizus MCA 3950]